MYEGSAIENASKLGEIGFGEFTSTLIKDVFTALIDAEMTQMEAYKELVTVLSKDLSTYINDTQNDVSITDIEDLIYGLNLPEADDTNNLLTAVNAGYATAMANANNTAPPTAPAALPVSDNAITALIQTLGPIVSDVVNGLLPPSNSTTNTPVTITGSTTPASVFGQTNNNAIPNYQAIYKAVAGKISNDKYTLLQTMVRTGLMRLVVDSGTIETRLTFDTYETHEDQVDTKHRDRTVTHEKEKGGRGSTLMSNLLKPGTSRNGNQNGRARAKQRGVVINTAKTHHRDAAGSHVQIFGRVEIKFKTDYMPLNQPQ